MRNDDRASDKHDTRTDTDSLFLESIEIINAGIFSDTAANQSLSADADNNAADRTASLAESLPTGKHFAVAVFEADPSNPEGIYDVRFNGDTFECAVRDKQTNPPVACRLSKSHLEEVCEEPATYIDRPMETALVWMMTRMAA